MHNDTYRPDIDGLRAISVLLVLVFHLGWPLFPGGFIGVDVFFVISGFLITRLIKTEAEDNRFTYLSFYERRVRRLFPAMFIVACACFLGATLIFLPQDLATFGGSLVYTLALSANHFFWIHSDYFGPTADTLPLLHMWSLSVEEQFYLIWPAIVASLLVKRGARLAISLVIGIGVISLLLNVAFSNGAPTAFERLAPSVGKSIDERQSAIFFLTPFRIFEFMFGAVIVWLPPLNRSRRILAELLFCAGIGAILFAATLLNKGSVFPSYNALLPCVGAALVIYAGHAPYAGIVVRNPAAVGLGKISYSLYLVHWPLIVFSKYYAFGHLSLWVECFIAILSIALAATMYFAVETPFRKRPAPGGRSNSPVKALLVAALLGIAICVPAVAARFQNGWPWRLPHAIAKQLAISEDDYLAFNRTTDATVDAGTFQEDGRSKVLVIGDSQARDAIRMLQALPTASSLQLRSHIIPGTCQPLYGVTRTERKKVVLPQYWDNCVRYFDALDREDRIGSADIIILAAHWTIGGARNAATISNSLSGSGAKRILVFGNKKLSLLGRQAVYMRYLRGDEATRRFLLATLPISDTVPNEILANSTSEHFQYVDFYNLICRADFGCDYITEDESMIMGDGLHVTAAGAEYFAKKIEAAGILNPTKN